MTEAVPYTPKQRKEMRKNLLRTFRVVEYFDFSGVLPDSPVQVNEGYIISDLETHELFASFAFQNTSGKQIMSLDIRLFLYQNANVPYEKKSFTYSYDNMTFGERKNGIVTKKGIFGTKQYTYCIAVGETFGRSAYIPIPDSYFRKIELEISKVTFSDSSFVTPKMIVRNQCTDFTELDDAKLYAFTRMNIYAAAEERYPTRVVPQFGETAWLCCCGQKNLATSEKCERCMRDRDWQKHVFDASVMEQKVEELKAANDYYRPDKTKYETSKNFEKEEEIQKRIAEYEAAMKRVAEQERRREHRRKMIIPKILIFIAVVIAISQLCIYLFGVFN